MVVAGGTGTDPEMHTLHLHPFAAHQYSGRRQKGFEQAVRYTELLQWKIEVQVMKEKKRRADKYEWKFEENDGKYRKNIFIYN